MMKKLALLSIIMFLTFKCQTQIYSGIGYDANIFRKVEIISFSEASHGSRNEYVARRALIDSLRKDGDTVNILVEMPFYAGKSIKKFYNGEIDTLELLKEFTYYGLRTNSFLELVSEYKFDQGVTFYGIDMQTHLSTLIDLRKTLFEYFPRQMESIKSITDSLMYDFNFDYNASQFENYYKTINNCLNKIDILIDTNSLVTSNVFWEVTFPIIIIKQYFKYIHLSKNSKSFSYILFRDSCMAVNISLIKENSDGKLFIISANGHCVNYENVNTMGTILKRKYGDKYFIIAAQYYQGSVLEPRVIDGVRNIVEIGVNPLKKSLPYKLRKLVCNKETLVYISISTDEELNLLFESNLLYQDFGSYRHKFKKSGYYYVIPRKSFDAIYYIPEVFPSEMVTND